jgi:hypothetical protein
MSRARDPKSWRELRDCLRDLGAGPVRTSGSHEVWPFSDGEVLVVVRNHLSAPGGCEHHGGVPAAETTPRGPPRRRTRTTRAHGVVVIPSCPEVTKDGSS